jgi:hypothetical protein
MGTTLTGLTPATTYDALLKTTDNQPLTTSLKVITDGLGNNSAFSLSTLAASITGTLAVSSTLTASNLSGTNTGDETQATIKSKLGIATTSVDGYLTSTDWTTFNNKVATTRSISTTAPLSGGGDLSANRTLSIAQSTTSTDGYLSSTDWNTFNSKQNTLTNPVTGTGTTNYIPKLTGASTIGNSQIFDNGSGVGIGTTTVGSLRLTVAGDTQFIGSTFATGSIQGSQNLDISGNGSIGYLGDGDYSLTASSSGVAVLGNFSVNNVSGSSLFAYNSTTSTLGFIGSLSMSGALSGATTIAMTGALSGATSITGSGKLSIADIGASGTLNIGSTTTATKRLELTADNNGAAENNTLRFVNTDTTISANEVIGKIEFFSADATAPGGTVKAYISANALDTSPDAYLDFATDAVTGTPIVRQRIQADGKVLIGSTTDNGSTNLVQVSGGLDYNIVYRAVVSTAWTLALTDKGKFIETTGGAATITIPTNAAVAFPIGTQIWFVQGSAGVPTFTADTGVTLRTRSSVRQPFARFSEVKLTKIATDEWYLTGDLKA